MKRAGAVLALLGVLYSHAAAAQQNAEMAYEIRAGNPETEWIELIRKDVEKVPDRIQIALNKSGGRIIIFDGNITDNPEFESYRGRTLPNRGLPYDVLDGKYLHRKAFVKQKVFRYTGSICVALHELGHMVDDVFGYPSESSEFMDTLNRSNKFYEGIEEPDQIWAESFARFYYSSESNTGLKNNFPKLHKYFMDFESVTANDDRASR